MTATLAPQLSCFITPPNSATVDYGHYLAYQGGKNGISVSQNFGRQGDTATISIVDANYSTGVPPNLKVSPSFVFPSFSVVKLFDQTAYNYYLGQGALPQDADDNATLFYGYVQTQTLYINSPTEAEWTLSCVDFSGYANAAIVQGTFEGISMGNAVVDLVKKANCGINASLVSDGGFVEPGPILPRTVIHYQNLTSALQKVSKMASSQSAYGWYVDSQLNLHYYDQQQAYDSGVVVTDKPTVEGYLSYYECHIDQGAGLQYEFDGSSLYNRALVVGGSITHSTTLKKPPTNSYVGDGQTSSWRLSYVPDTSARAVTTQTLKKTVLPAITVNGVQQSISIFDGITPVTDKWTIAQNNDGTWSLKVTPNYGTIPTTGSVIHLWYRYRSTITAQADLKQSQNAIGGLNKGIFAIVVNQQSISTTAGAYQRATRELAEYGHPQEKIVFTTNEEWIGLWRAGQLFILDSSLLLDSQRNFAPGLYAQYMITQQTINVTQGGYRKCSVTGIRVLH